MSRLPFLAVLSAAGVLGALGQDITPTVPSRPDSLDARNTTARITLTTDPSGAEMLLDSTLLGRSPIIGAELTAGKHTIRARYPSLEQWDASSLTDTIDLAPGAEISRFFLLSTPVRLDSRPQGATLIEQGRSVGTTPLYYQVGTHSPSLLLAVPGFDTMTVSRAALLNLAGPVELRPVVGTPPPVQTPAIDASKERLHDWPAFVAASVMIASGVLSAYFKVQANHNFDSYSNTGNNALLSKTHTQDRISGTALVVTEVSFAVLSYLLLSD